MKISNALQMKMKTNCNENALNIQSNYNAKSKNIPMHTKNSLKIQGHENAMALTLQMHYNIYEI